MDLLDRRRSTPSSCLAEPGPDHATLLRMLASAVRVPDHGKLVPWRFLLVRGDARQRLGEALAQRRRQAEPEVLQSAVDKDRGRFDRAPVIIIVVARLQHGRIPQQEQLLSGGCVCFALLLAAQQHGFGAQWLTGWAAYDAHIAQLLGLGADERVLGFIHVGTPVTEVPDRPRPDPAALLSEWRGPGTIEPGTIEPGTIGTWENT